MTDGQCFGSRSGLDPDSLRSVDPYPDPGGQKWPTKTKKVRKLNVLKCLMFSFEGWRLLHVACTCLGISKLQFVIQKISIFSAVYFYNFWSTKPWIWISIQPKMLNLNPESINPDLESMNPDPRHCRRLLVRRKLPLTRLIITGDTCNRDRVKSSGQTFCPILEQ